MAGEWPEVSLSALAQDHDGAIAIGPFGSAMKADRYVAVGVPVIRGTNISSSRALAGDWVFVSEPFADSMPRCNVQFNDLVFPHRGSVGLVGIIPEELSRYVISSSLMKITIDNRKADPRFIYYYFRSGRGHAEIMRFVSQVGTPGIGQPLTSLRQFSVACPPLPVQRAVADLLGSIDDKLDMDRRMAETLEAMDRALFKSWFVDFDPVHARFEGRPTGLPDDLAALFPDSFVEGHRGPLPSSWRVAPLSELADVARGLSYKGDGLRTTGLPLLNLNSIYEGGGYKDEGLKYYNGPYGVRHEVRGGDIIVANTEQGHHRRLIGYAAMVPDVGKPAGIFSQHLYRLRMRPSATVSAYWLLELLNARTTHDVVSSYANGSTVNMLPIEAMKDPQFPIPSPAVAAAFDKIVQPSFERRQQLSHESRTLAALCDTLLPKLISGELRIADAERQIAAA